VSYEYKPVYFVACTCKQVQFSENTKLTSDIGGW